MEGRQKRVSIRCFAVDARQHSGMYLWCATATALSRAGEVDPDPPLPLPLLFSLLHPAPPPYAARRSKTSGSEC